MTLFYRLVSVLLCLASVIRAQSAAPDPSTDAEGIRISALIEPREVPLNRTAHLTVRLEWAGDLDRYEVQRFDSPLMENFNILSTSSANRVRVVEGRPFAVQEFNFTLKPEVLGMAYVDGMAVRYSDAVTGKEYRLFANRLEAKVIDPLPEPGSYAWMLWIIGFLIAGGVAAYLLRQQHRKKEAARKAEEARRATVQTIEQRFHAQLRESIDLHTVDLDVRAAFERLSRLVRLYLAEKFFQGQMGQTTSELITALKSHNAGDRLAADAGEILSTADVAKFSGAAASRDKLERMYTLFESWLSANPASTQEMLL